MTNDKGLVSELADYIKKNLKKGYTKDALNFALLDQGYSKLEIKKALKRVDLEMASQAPVLKTKQEIKYEIIEPKQEKAQKHKIKIEKKESLFGRIIKKWF